jgi:hypothetical protein
MKFDILFSKHVKLKKTIEDNFLFKAVGHKEVDEIVELFEKFEDENLQTIQKLNRHKTIEAKKISGALRQTINVHGPITKVLIGSATKRIYGALLEPKIKLNFWQRILKLVKL